MPAPVSILAGALAALATLGWARAHRAHTAAAARSRDASAEAAHATHTLAAYRQRQALRAADARRLEHDLRSPVGAMAVALELLRTAEDEATRREAIDVLQRQAARMTSLTEQVHEFARGMAD